MSNKSLGNDFERYLAKYLSDKGFWVHLLTQNQTGQPADMIACNNRHAYLIDAKVCSNDRFPLSRIEDNQWYSMEHWRETVNTEPQFAMLLSDGAVYMIALCHLARLEGEGKKSLNRQDITGLGYPLESWVNMVWI